MNCTTHHHACDCREKRTKQLVREMFEWIKDEWRNDLGTEEFRKEAIELGYLDEAVMTQETLDEHLKRHKAFIDSLPLYKDRKNGMGMFKDEAGRVYAVDGMYLIDGPEYEKKGAVCLMKSGNGA